jgi:arylsulfatase A-like enzyme
LFLIALAFAFSLNADAADRPNIILMMADDQGWGEVGYNGHPHVLTPTLDNMAATGLRLDRFYAGAPVCSPTRASFMTGRHPNRSGVFAPNYAVRPQEITIARILRDNGYRTAHFGKWHLGPVKKGAPNNPRAMGFEEYLSHDNFYELDPPLSRNGATPQIVKGEGSFIAVDEGVKFIEKVKGGDDPFFIVLWFGSPHLPYRGVEEDLKKYTHIDSKTMRNRYAEITAMDRAIGKLRNYLKAEGLADNTFLWFTSDNGDPVKTETGSYKGDLREKKGSLYEGGIRVPTVIEWPAVIKRHRVSDIPAVTSDILPTVLDIVGLEHPDPARPLDGISLKPLIAGKAMNRRPSPIGFWKYPGNAETKNGPYLDPASQLGTTPTFDNNLHGPEHRFEAGPITGTLPNVRNPAIEFRNWKHPVAKTKDFGGTAAWTDNRYKLVVTEGMRGGPVDELYDIPADPFEQNDLAKTRPEVVKRMRQQLDAWRASVEQSLSGADY